MFASPVLRLRSLGKSRTGLRRSRSSSTAIAVTTSFVTIALAATACTGAEDVSVRVSPTVTEEGPSLVASVADIERARADDPFFEVTRDVNPEIPALVGSSEQDRVMGDVMGLGGLATETIDGEPLLPGICAGAAARIVRSGANKELPVSVKWFGCNDDRGSIDGAAELVGELRAEDAFAIVPLASRAFFDEIALNETRVPYVGVGSQYCGVENSFGFSAVGATACPVLDVFGLTVASSGVIRAYLDGTGRSGPIRVAHIVDNSPTGEELARVRLVEIEAAGAERVAVETDLGLFPSEEELVAATDRILADDPTVVLLELENTADLYVALRDAGFDGDLVGTQYGDPALLAADPRLHAAVAGSYQVVQGVAVLGQSGAWPALRADAEANGDDLSDIGLGYVYGYVSMDIFLAALDRVPGTPSAEAFHDVINGGWMYPGLPEVSCRVPWPMAHLVDTPCASVVRVLERESGIVESVLPLTEFDVIARPVDEADE